MNVFPAGAIIRLGSSHLFRFNDPGEAARLRQEMKTVSEQILTDFCLSSRSVGNIYVVVMTFLVCKMHLQCNINI